MNVLSLLSLHSTTLQTEEGDILLDFSKNLINQEVLDMLLLLVTHTLTHTLAHTHTQVLQVQPVGLRESVQC